MSYEGITTGAPSRSVEGTMNYLGPMEGTPYVDVQNRGRDRLTVESHRVTFTDARPIAGQLSLEREGFRLLQHRTSMTRAEFQDPERVREVYLREMAEVVKAETGADRVVSALGPVLRFNGERQNTVKPAAIAHSDYSEYTLRAQMAFQLGLSAPEFRPYRRIVAYQTWRALSPPPQDNTLALCDSRTVSVADRVLSKFDVTQPRSATLEFYMYRFNAAHRWYYFEDLTSEELVVFKGFEGDGPDRQNVLHGAFAPPPTPNAIPRESIETRTFAFFS
ncbi:MAG TPA: CmcJ/NvfI family oxidoreductase [Gammaproteobacteria bacterium]|nr:CmcJ/NvfI family oxidoreductase [Gammaproteobacteria bacterium]